MSAHTTHADHDDHAHDHTPGFFTRWFMSTNHKDIGALYIILLSSRRACRRLFLHADARAELRQPGVQFAANGHNWNVWAPPTV